MQPLIFIGLLLFLSSCKIDLFNSDFEETGKITNRLIFHDTGEPIAGMIVKTTAISRGYFNSSILNVQFSFTDENGYFQMPKMEKGQTSHNFHFKSTSDKTKNLMIIESNCVTCDQITHAQFEAFRLKNMKLNLIYDTSKVSNFSFNIQYVQANHHLDFDPNKISTLKNQSISFDVCPPFVKKVILQIQGKNNGLYNDVEIIIPNLIEGDTCFSTIVL